MPARLETLAILIAVHVTTTVGADILTVPGEYPTINAAIFAASDGDTIQVSSGTYLETILVVGTTLEIVAVEDAATTVIQAPGGSAFGCISVSGLGSSGTSIRGFTIRGGDSTFGSGGGLLVAGGAEDVTVTDCVFENNTAGVDGGGAAVDASSTAHFADCIFLGNTAAGDGGGLAILANGGFTVERCRFLGNAAGGDGGGARVGDSTNLDPDETFPRVLNSIFSGNTADGAGGGAYVVSAGIDCPVPCFLAGGAYGCTFSRNTASTGGAIDGGAAFQGAPLNVVNCILSGNSGDYALVDLFGLEVVFTPSFLNCNVDFAGDPAPRFVLELGPDGVAGTGDEVFQVLPGSPCIDAGYVYAGESAVLNGDFDVTGGPRRIDSTYTEDTGTTEGPLPIVDIGAHEYADQDAVDSVAVWTGSSGSFTAPANWYQGSTPDIGLATWLDGPADPTTETTLRGSVTIGELFVNSGSWSITGTATGSARSISVGREGEQGKEPGSLFIAPYDGERASLELSNLSLFCEDLLIARGDFGFGPIEDGGDVSVDAASVIIATDSETRLASTFRGAGSVNTTPVGPLPSFWNLGITQPTGPLAIAGNYYQSGGVTFPDTIGRLRFDLSDPNQSLDVSGRALLGGPVEFAIDPLDTPDLKVGETFTIVTATEGFDGTDFALTQTSGLGDGLFFTITTTESATGPGSTVVATVNSAEELLLGDSGGDATDAVADAIVVDVDGVDGPDLVLSVPNSADPSGTDGALVILLNEGTSGATWDGFEAYGTAVAVTVGKNPAGLDAGDLDGDGDLDLVVANRGDGEITILLNDGTGTSYTSIDVDSQPNLAGNADPLDVYVGDLDGDGDADIAVTNGADGSVVAFENLTTSLAGGFGGVDGGTESDPGDKITAFEPGQAQGKDRDDRVKGTSSGSNTVNTSSTALTAGPGIVLTWASTPVGSTPSDLAVGSLDGANGPDVVTANEGGGTISLLLNDAAGGYLPAITVAIGDAPRSIDIGDLDGDGDSDIAVVCENTSGDRVLRVVQNMLEESGELAWVVLASDLLLAEDPFLVRIRDVDGDVAGIEDVVALTGSPALTGTVDGFSTLVGLGKSRPCLGDINGDEIVDAADLGLLIISWGGPGAGDLNEDGNVDAADLGLLISAWGPCS